MMMIAPFVFSLLSLFVGIDVPHEGKIAGVCLVSPPKAIGQEKMAEVKRVNAQWVSVIPYGFSREGQPDVTFDSQRQWWGERTEGSVQLIQYAKSEGLKVMLKPHIWVMGQGWAGDYDLDTEAEWIKWEDSFSTYILHYARIADSLGVELLCIGTEYRIPARERPLFWRNLIDEIRSVYCGKLTYAANWDNYMNIAWWDEVDFIGVDAYFPLVKDESEPSKAKIMKAWNPFVQDLKSWAKKWDRPILFTEYGFQSVDGACGEHWNVDKSAGNVNEALQAVAYDATWERLKAESWFKGGFLWKWHFVESRWGDRSTAWTPQNKKAEEVIKDWYGKLK